MHDLILAQADDTDDDLDDLHLDDLQRSLSTQTVLLFCYS